MIDFKKYGTRVGAKRTSTTDLESLFESLDRRTSHTELRKSQTEALKSLTATRPQRDHVLKVSTGAGKTSVGLLYLRSHSIEEKSASVYLCPNNQLVQQVMAEASCLGLKAVPYPAGESHPDSDVFSGNAILVCTYKKLFTARSTFDRADVRLSPCAVVLDDAHAGIEAIRDSFTIRLAARTELAKTIRELFDPAIRAWMPGVWAGVLRDDPAAIVEVPYWIWRPLAAQIRELFSNAARDEGLRFVWPHVQDRLEQCRCIVGGEGVEVGPDILPVEDIRAFSEAPHRLFMSATLADDSALVRELGCDAAAAKAPIEPVSDAGIGERMVLVPSLIDTSLSQDWLRTWCGRMAKGKYSVVALCPTRVIAQEWARNGAVVTFGDDVENTVARLRDGSLRIAAFANRYDGVDLPDDACRILVIDGMPFGESMTARHDAFIPGRPDASQNRLVHRIEQGMGRAVRSHVDYAVVVLAGPELATFVSRSEVLKLFNPATRAQLGLSKKLAEISLSEVSEGKEATDVFSDLARACLKRDGSWKEYYNTEIRDAAKEKRLPNEAAIDLAAAERAAARIADHDPHKACETIRKAARPPLVTDDHTLGWYLQRAACFEFAANEADALKLQVAAFEKNSRMFRPPRGAASRPSSKDGARAGATVLRWYSGFENANGAVAYVQSVRARLSFGCSATTFERAISELAEAVGAIGMRPEFEYGVGPDGLWLWDALSLVIECKNEEGGQLLPKRDSGQLHDSVAWFKKAWPMKEPTPVVVARASTAHSKAHFPENTRVLTEEGLEGFLDAVERFVAELIRTPTEQWTPKLVTDLAAKMGVGSAQFLGKYTKKLG